MVETSLIILRGPRLEPWAVSDTFWRAAAEPGGPPRNWERAALLARLAYLRRRPLSYVIERGRVSALPQYRRGRLWGVALLFEPASAAASRRAIA